MKRAIAAAAAAAVVVWLPEANRVDLAIVAALVYGCASYFAGALMDTFARMREERERLSGLRWTRRNPPALVDIQGRPEYPVIVDEPGYLLYQTGGGTCRE